MSIPQGSKTIAGESSQTAMPPGFLETVAATGIDPRVLFGTESGKCRCAWTGHAVFNFTGLGGQGWPNQSYS